MQRRPSGKMPTSYVKGTFISEGAEVPALRIKERDRRMLKDNPGKIFSVDVLDMSATRKRFSRLNPRKYT